MDLFCQRLNKLIKIIAEVILIVMVVTIFSQVIMRYFFENPLMWSEELSRYLYAWFCFFGVSIATFDKSHLKVTFFVEKLSKIIQYYLELFSMVLMILFFIAVSWSAVLLPKVQGNMMAYSLGIPFWMLSISMVPGFFVSSIYTITHLYHNITNKRGYR